jgi:Family of unknown function (DUF6152)
MKPRFFTIATALLMLAGSAAAHHGYAAFDTKSEITLQATVTDFHFVNPHSIVEFDAKDDRGDVRNWQGELTSPSHLASRGWTATTLQAGDEISITGYRAKNGRPSIWVTKIRRANGQELKLDSGN